MEASQGAPWSGKRYVILSSPPRAFTASLASSGGAVSMSTDGTIAWGSGDIFDAGNSSCALRDSSSATR